jgi:two-component sensor histidine kinase
VLAIFSVYWNEEHEPSDRELRVLDLCADLAGRHVERSVAEARQALLARELAHRGKNLLSVIQAIATRSFHSKRTLDEARAVFVGRLQALAQTYSMLTDGAPESTQLHEIVSAGLRSHGERADIRGPAVVVTAKVAQTLSLVIHELATNAAKYGALCSDQGRIEVLWEVTMSGSDARFLLKWSERGGPPTHPPAHKGFGSAIMTSVVGGELNCAPTMEYAVDGFRYSLECSLSALSTGA